MSEHVGVQRVSGSTLETDYTQVVSLPRPLLTEPGDLIVAILGMNEGGSYTLPSGWETVLDHDIPGSQSAIAIVQHRMNDAEPSSYTFEFENRNWTSVCAEALRNAGPLQAQDLNVRSDAAIDALSVPTVPNGGRSLGVLAGFSSRGGFLSWEPEPLTVLRSGNGGTITATAITDGADYLLRASHGFAGSMAAFAGLVRPKTPTPEPNPPLAVTFRDTPGASDVKRVVELGMNLARFRISWDELEPTIGTFDAAALSELREMVGRFDAAGITLLAWLDGEQPPAQRGTIAQWKDFCERIALEVIPLGVRHFQFWSEPNLAASWPSPDGTSYTTECLVPGSEAVADAAEASGFGAFVLFGGLTPATASGDVDMVDFLEAAYSAGAKGAFHAMAYHPANDPEPPDFDEVLGLRSTMVNEGDDELKVWVTDIGWPSRDSTRHEVYPLDASSPFVSHERAAKYARRAPELWDDLGEWTGPMLWAARDTEFDVPGFSHRRNAAGLLLRNLSRKGAWFRWQREARKRRQPEPDTPTSISDDPEGTPTPSQFRTSAITAVEVDASWREAAGMHYRLIRERFVGSGSPETPDDPDAAPTPRPLITSVRMAGASGVVVGTPQIVVSASVSLHGESKGREPRAQLDAYASVSVEGTGQAAASTAGQVSAGASLAGAGSASADGEVVVPSTDTWVTDFSGASLGGTMPSGLTARVDGGSFSISDNVPSGSVGGRCLRLDPDGASFERFVSLDFADNETDVEIVIRTAYEFDDDSYKGSIYLRSENDPEDDSYVFVWVRNVEGDYVTIEKYDSGYADLSGTVTENVQPAPDVWYWLRARVNGGEQFVKVWLDGEPEPAEWTTTDDDTGISAGPRHGVGGWDGSASILFDVVGVAINGETAPTS